MTTAMIMFYGGIAGVVISLLTLAVMLKSFEKKRKKELEKIMKSM